MSSIRTQISHKLIMLGIFFLGMLLNSQYEAWSSSDTDANQARNPSSEIQYEQTQEGEVSDDKKEDIESNLASYS
ncbi:hypothetical protein [Muriicola soli]|uniref:Uncharacterized protein n=1 Tax=Muriicola soli TaxID=2507538 RepID=A0A411EBW2_9FLAO|nr:hypothetical protein [Muriicola soli]QBA64930.1 hypothetical protein EQY75_10570 [Muriicola soli]